MAKQTVVNHENTKNCLMQIHGHNTKSNNMVDQSSCGDVTATFTWSSFPVCTCVKTLRPLFAFSPTPVPTLSWGGRACQWTPCCFSQTSSDPLTSGWTYIMLRKLTHECGMERVWEGGRSTNFPMFFMRIRASIGISSSSLCSRTNNTCSWCTLRVHNNV